MIVYEVKGWEGIESILEGLTRSEATRAKQNANMVGARIFRNALKPRIPRSVGQKIRKYRSTKFTKKGTAKHWRGQTENVHLRNRIGFKRSKKSDAVIVGYVGLARAYGHIVEFGKREGAPFVSRGNGAWRKTIAEKTPAMVEAMGNSIGAEVLKIWQKRMKRYANKITKFRGY